MSQTILFVHGFMNTGRVWQDWQTYFEDRGYRCYAPSWPYMEGDLAQLHQNPQSERAETTFAQVAQHYRDFIQNLPEKPIIIGHSLGGIITQKLLEMDLASATIAINSGPPKGILAWNKDFLLSNLLLTNLCPATLGPHV